MTAFDSTFGIKANSGFLLQRHLGEIKILLCIKYQYEFTNSRNDWRAAMASGEYQGLLEFLTSTFDSFSEMVTVFKVCFQQK